MSIMCIVSECIIVKMISSNIFYSPGILDLCVYVCVCTTVIIIQVVLEVHELEACSC